MAEKIRLDEKVLYFLPAWYGEIGILSTHGWLVMMQCGVSLSPPACGVPHADQLTCSGGLETATLFCPQADRGQRGVTWLPGWPQRAYGQLARVGLGGRTSRVQLSVAGLFILRAMGARAWRREHPGPRGKRKFMEPSFRHLDLEIPNIFI